MDLPPAPSCHEAHVGIVSIEEASGPTFKESDRSPLATRVTAAVPGDGPRLAISAGVAGRPAVARLVGGRPYHGVLT